MPFNHWRTLPCLAEYVQIKYCHLVFTEEEKAINPQHLQTYRWSHCRIPIFFFCTLNCLINVWTKTHPPPTTRDRNNWGKPKEISCIVSWSRQQDRHQIDARWGLYYNGCHRKCTISYNSLVFSPDEKCSFFYVKLQQLSSIVNTNNIIVLIKKNLNIDRGKKLIIMWLPLQEIK